MAKISRTRQAQSQQGRHRVDVGHPQSDLTETAMSRTIKFAKAGGPEVLEFVEVQVPAPGPNEVRIKVKAIGINRAEAMWRGHDYIPPRKKIPAGLRYQALGTGRA